MFESTVMKYENTVRPRNMPHMLKILSLLVIGTMSPKPVVLIVANVQYMAATYLHSQTVANTQPW